MTEELVVFDTNLWISRLLVPKGIAGRAVDHALSWSTPLVSEATMQELSEVLSRPKFNRYVSVEDRKKFLQLIGGVARMVTVYTKIAVCRDPNDDKFLDVALAGGSNLLITGDADLLELHPFHGIEIITPRELLKLQKI